jgi:hypothetical protein
MEHKTYREDEGRVYQAASDYYAVACFIVACPLADLRSFLRVRIIGTMTMLMVDMRETNRLDIQHHAFKTAQGNKNYLAPIEQLLNAGTIEERKERKVLDVGCGSGIW